MSGDVVPASAMAPTAPLDTKIFALSDVKRGVAYTVFEGVMMSEPIATGDPGWW